MFAVVVPFGQSFDDIGFTYLIPESLLDVLKIGMVVNVPFGKNEVFGVVLEIKKDSEFDKIKIKEIIGIYNNTKFLYDYQVSLLRWICEYYFCLAHQGLSLFFPKNLKSKIEKNKLVFKEGKTINYEYKNSKVLNTNQQKIFDEIVTSSESKFLLYGVTGSGKTEVYINLIKHYLDEGKQSLLLVPEIILTNQIFERIQKVFGKEVLILNSTVSEAKKTLYFEQIHSGNAKIIVGTRSAIFYPYCDLGIIIVDEEHDNSYVSDNAPRYDCIEVATKISDLTNTKLLLGSGTPKINHMYDAIKGKYKVLNLFSEFK